ncbi:DNA ligase [Striga asiatica]|uniref:DNA ligase n=1 Tax=Striga asiatica TaxID=4170 RepID=A0A5A7Q2Y2_STRAF|nr:DNA ligase [Striga asiatica]
MSSKPDLFLPASRSMYMRSGIQVHPLTKTLAWFIRSSPHSISPPAFCKDAIFDLLAGESACFCLNLGQPTCESHFSKASNRSLKGSGVEVIESLDDDDGNENLADGNSRKPVRKTMIRVKPNMNVIVRVLMGFNCIMEKPEEVQYKFVLVCLVCMFF